MKHELERELTLGLGLEIHALGREKKKEAYRSRGISTAE